MIELAICISGIYVCFLTWGILQERVSTTPYHAHDDIYKVEPASKFSHFVFLNFTQAALASSVAFLYVVLMHRARTTAVIKKNLKSSLLLQYCLVAFFGSVASPFGYEALKHVDYPTMILAKSCKLLPVVLMGFLLHRRVFEWYKYLSVALITLGVSMFTLMQSSHGKESASRTNSVYGLILLAINLLIDGVTNSTQDHIFIRYRVSGPEMMLFMNLFSTAIMLIYMTVVAPVIWGSGVSELAEAISFLSVYRDCIKDVLLFGLCGAVGQVFIFYTLQRFGSLLLVTVNVTRKMFSMLLSVLWFGHVLNVWQWLGVGVVFAGIGVEAQVSRMQKLRNTAAKQSIAADVTKAEESVDIVAAETGPLAAPQKTSKSRNRRKRANNK